MSSKRNLAFCIAAVLMSGWYLAGSAQGQTYKPSLGDIMGAAQLRHFKLWYAGKRHNWDLAEYELGQIQESFSSAMTLYPNIPVADMSVMGPAVVALGEAVKAKDSFRFAKAFGKMTKSCNACHTAIGRGFIRIQIPTSSPFSNQSFAPGSKQ